MKHSHNPFNPNSVVVPTLFAGRTEQVVEICQKLVQLKNSMPASFFLHGERGIGKTALAKLVKSIAIANNPELYRLNLLTSYYSVEKNQDLSSVLQASINSLTDQMSKDLISRIGSRLGSLFQNGKFSIGAFGVSVGAVMDTDQQRQQMSITVKDQTVSILGNLIREMATTEESAQDGILIIVDEMHNLKNLAEAASVIRNIITTLDVAEQGKVAFLLIGYDGDVEEFFSEDSSARRIFDIYQMGVMPNNEAIQILSKGFESIKIKWDAAALEQNINSAGGYPHSIQRLGHNLIATDTDGNIDAPDWTTASLKTANDLKSKEFLKMFSFDKPLTSKDRVLVQMALSGDTLTRQQLVQRTSSKNIYQDISALKKTSAINEDDKGRLHLHSQLFRTAILFDHFLRESLNELPHSRRT